MSRYLVVVIVSLVSAPVMAAEQLNTYFIRGHYSQLPDVLRSDETQGLFPSGEYLLDIYFNKEKTGRERIKVEQGQQQGLCYSKEFLAKHSIALKQEAFVSNYDKAGNCFRINDHPDASVELDPAKQTLRFKLPQGLIADSGNQLMSQWDHGVRGANIQYSYRGTQSERNGLTQFGEIGGNVNVGRWVLSGRAYNYNDEGITVPQYSLSTASAALRGEVGIGKMQLQASLINGFAFDGVSLVSDNQMTPWLSQSYAPVISGIARTEAVITVRQQGYIIYSQSVPPGPYALTNLSGVSSGDLEVTVREDDGSEKVDVYPVSILPSLLRPGHLNYSFAAGRKALRGGDLVDYGGTFALAAADYGMTLFTLNTSVLFDKNYQNMGTGVTRSFGSWGAISASGNMSNSTRLSGDELRGYTLSFKYAKNVLKDTTLQIAGYRYASQDYIDYVDYYPGIDGGKGIKNRLEAFMTHRNDRTLYSGSIWRQNDWEGKAGVGASLRMSHPVGAVTVTANLNYGVVQNRQDQAGNKTLSAGLSFSLPLSYFERRAHNTTSLSASRGGEFTATSNVSGMLTDRTRYTVNAGRSQSGVNTYASLSHGFDAVNTSVSVSDSAGHRTIAGSVSGSVVQAGDSRPVFTRIRNETVAVVDTEGLSGARFGRSQADSNGNAVVTLTPYNRNTVKVDATGLPHNIELDSTTHNVIPTRRSVHQIKFGHRQINRYILKVLMGGSANKPAPFNTVALGDDGQQLGFITEGGILMLSNEGGLPALTLSLPKGGTCLIAPAGIVPNTQYVQEVMCE